MSSNKKKCNGLYNFNDLIKAGMKLSKADSIKCPDNFLQYSLGSHTYLCCNKVVTIKNEIRYYCHFCLRKDYFKQHPDRINHLCKNVDLDKLYFEQQAKKHKDKTIQEEIYKRIL